MATTYLNPDYPHTAVITRKTTSATPPYATATSTIWSGACDCQIGSSGTTETRDTVFVSDYTIYTACIEAELKTGDLISIIRKTGHTPIIATIEQHSTDNIWIENGIQYGTTIWANEVKQ